jgi:calcium-dependent protein kinase
MAPEVLKGDYNHQCDMWSAGVLLYVLLSGYPPFFGETDHEVYAEIIKGDYDFEEEIWEDISDNAKDLICKLLCKPEERLNSENALNHSWIKEQGKILMQLKKQKSIISETSDKILS